MKMMIEVYDKCKYNPDSQLVQRVRFDNVVKYEVVSGASAEEIEKFINPNDKDDYHEYLNLYFDDGEIGTYRNSYVDLFRI